MKASKKDLMKSMDAIMMGGGPEETFELLKKKKKILQRGLRCKICHTECYSNYRHHFMTCQCPETTQIFIDGGFAYSRHPVGPQVQYVHIQIFLTKEILEKELDRPSTW